MSWTAERSLQEPVSAVVNIYGEMVVICSDGSAWSKKEKDAWLELEPIPGSSRAKQLQQEQKNAGANG